MISKPLRSLPPLRRRLALLSLLLPLLAGCAPSSPTSSSAGSGPETTAGTATPSSRGVIGVSLLTFENPFFKVIADHIESAAKEKGYRVVSLSADESPARQSQQIDDFIVQKVSAIVLSPCEARAVVPSIQAANKAGIPVFTVDIPCREEGVEIACQIATDNKGGGKEAAKAMIEAIGGGKVAIIHFQQAESCRLRVEGFREEVAAHNAKTTDAASRIDIVAEFDGGGAKDKGRTATADALQSNPDLRGLFAINDPSALGAVAAVEEAGRAGQVTIIGFDGQPEGRQAIKDGKIYADPIQYPDKMGTGVVDAIVRHLKGEELSPEQFIPTSLYRRADAEKDPELR